MKNRFIVIYTIFAAAVFIFSMAFFGYNLYNEYSTNLQKSEAKNTLLVNNIRTLSMDYAENTSVYSQAIQKAIGDAGNYSYIQIRRNNETVVLYPNGRTKEETISKLTRNFNTNITVNKQPVYIDVNYYLIRPDSIFYFARISFLMILIITIITIIMIIYLNLSEASSDVISLEEDSEIETESDNEIESEEDSEINETVITEASDEASSENDIDETDESQKLSETEPEVEDEKPSAEVTPEEVQAILSEPLTDEENKSTEEKEAAKLPLDEVAPAPLPENQLPSNNSEPSGLFNPDTGIGWESYLMTRLNNEIERATASEIDLSLFVIKLPLIDKASDIFKNVCNYLAIQFQFKDLLFEYKEDCIVAIKISMNVDEALILADKLYTDICNIVDNKSPRIGISSRSIRMVTGDRLVLEAEQAIEHSDSNSPVIAFRVDSEKYRMLMEQSQEN